MKKVLFILKQRETLYTDEYNNSSYGTLESGLFNSANFVNSMLNKQQGFESNIVQVIDNNFIDREVTKYKPDIVIIEAFWVVPEKFKVLTALHPNVIWIVRNHSKTPFLSNEGIAMDWTLQYLQIPKVYVSSNSFQATDDLYSINYSRKYMPYLPNYYPISKQPIYERTFNVFPEEVHIGCFGAIRPLKNQLTQAIAAIKFADKIEKKLVFHINASRIEGNGSPILKNIRKLFENLSGKTEHKLVEHNWLKHQDFLKLIADMDYGLQVSYSETFNIVCADMVSQGVPVIVSDEIDWMPKFYHANPNDSNNIVKKLLRLGGFKHLISDALCGSPKEKLKKYNKESVIQWTGVLNNI